MGETIKPALTAEEWAEHLAIMAKGLDPERHAAVDIAESVDTLATPNFHRAAALALHGRPFGFTREQLEELRVAAENGDLTEPHLLWQIVERIESLLPPNPAEPADRPWDGRE